MLYAISDLHGNYRAWRALKEALGSEDRCIVLGDACDRGDEGVKIMLEIKHDSRFVYVVGNHDDFVLRSYLPEYVYSAEHTSSWGRGCWLYNTGPSIGEWESLRESKPEEFEELLEWLAECPAFLKLVCNGRVFNLAHARYPKEVRCSSMSWKDMERTNPDLLFHVMWDRYTKDGPIEDYVEAGTTTLIGHTPIMGKDPKVHTDPGSLYNLDGGAGYGATRLTCYCLSDGKVYYLDIAGKKKPKLPHGPTNFEFVNDFEFEGFIDPNSQEFTDIPEVEKQLEGGRNRFCLVGTTQEAGFKGLRVQSPEVRKILRTGNSILAFTDNAVYNIV